MLFCESQPTSWPDACMTMFFMLFALVVMILASGGIKIEAKK